MAVYKHTTNVYLADSNNLYVMLLKIRAKRNTCARPPVRIGLDWKSSALRFYTYATERMISAKVITLAAEVTHPVKFLGDRSLRSVC